MAAASHPVAGQAPAVVLCQDSTTYDLDGFVVWPVNGNAGPRGMVGMTSDGLGNMTLTVPHVYWSSDMKVRGTVRVPAGCTLHITQQMDGSRTVVQFADTRKTVTLAQLAPPYNRATRIVVEKATVAFPEAGILEVGANVTLTSLQGCPNSMWDGIVLQGATPPAGSTAPDQSSSAYGTCYLGTTNIADALRPVVANARIAVLAGRPQYSNVDGRLLTSYADGGGVLLAQNTDFRNCHTGVTLLDYPYHDNKTDIFDCGFLSDTPLADPLYITGGGVRYGTQMGVYMSGVQGVRFVGNLFELTDNNAAFNNQQLLYNLRGIGISLNNAQAEVVGAVGNPNVFRRLSTGINANNPDPSYSLKAFGNRFENNYTGIWMANTTAVIVRDNTFLVGRVTDVYAIGMRMSRSTGFTVTRNTFAAGFTWPSTTVGQEIRGAEFWELDRIPHPVEPNYDEVYRNYFERLTDGILVSSANGPFLWNGQWKTIPIGNTGLQIKCNDFRTGATSGTANTITRMNLAIQVNSGTTGVPALDRAQGLPNQGSCVLPSNPARFLTPAGNLFSHTCVPGSAWDMRQIGTGFLPFDYSHHPENPFPTQPGAPSIYCMGGATLQPCQAPLVGRSFEDFCPLRRAVGTATEAALLAQADTAAASADRQQAINELLRRYLNDSVDVRAGVDAARAMLALLNEPAYAALRQALDARSSPAAQRLAGSPGGGGTPETSARPAAVRRLSPRKAAQAAADAVAQARTLYADYSARIRALLAPYETDSAAQHALRTNAPLRAEIVRIAHDSTTSAFTEGRAVLTQYLGYRFVDGRLDAIGDDLGATGQRAAPTPRGIRPDVATFYPNPTADGHLRVAYALPPTDRLVRLELTDRYGIVRLTQALKAHAVEAELNLSALPAGLYQYRLRVGEEVVQSGTLVRLP